jgi:hypothetical protein
MWRTNVQTPQCYSLEYDRVGYLIHSSFSILNFQLSIAYTPDHAGKHHYIHRDRQGSVAQQRELSARLN